MMLESFPDLMTAYLEEHLNGKPSYYNSVCAASEWIRTLTTTPTRADILAEDRRKSGIATPHATDAMACRVEGHQALRAA